MKGVLQSSYIRHKKGLFWASHFRTTQKSLAGLNANSEFQIYAARAALEILLYALKKGTMLGIRFGTTQKSLRGLNAINGSRHTQCVQPWKFWASVLVPLKVFGGIECYQ